MLKIFFFRNNFLVVSILFFVVLFFFYKKKVVPTTQLTTGGEDLIKKKNVQNKNFWLFQFCCFVFFKKSPLHSWLQVVKTFLYNFFTVLMTIVCIFFDSGDHLNVYFFSNGTIIGKWIILNMDANPKLL